MTACEWQATNTPPCGAPSVALVYKGSAEHMLDRYFRPLCDRHLNMSTSTHYPRALPLNDGGTYVVALRELPARVLRCADCGWYEGDPVCDVDCPNAGRVAVSS